MTDLTGKVLGRRSFFQGLGAAGIAATAAGIAGGSFSPLQGAFADSGASDDPVKIFTAALIAEDLATTFYYNVLVGKVIQDANLAGPGGTATRIAPSGNAGNVNYIQAALTEEIQHANLLRALLKGSGAASDPVQKFYFPAGVFDTLGAFTGLLDALESAFIGAYLAATRQFALFAKRSAADHAFYSNADNTHTYGVDELIYYSQVAASIMGIECEHRVLGRVISNTNPANNLIYEQTDNIANVYSGSMSAVVALTPFLTPSTGPGYTLAEALANQASVSLPATGGLPAF